MLIILCFLAELFHFSSVYFGDYSDCRWWHGADYNSYYYRGCCRLEEKETKNRRTRVGIRQVRSKLLKTLTAHNNDL